MSPATLSAAAAALLLGTVTAGAQSTARPDTLRPAPMPDTLAPAAATSGPSVVKHTVKPGDTLWDIAKFYLKDPFRWPEVFHANTDIVKNPHWIYPGQVLTIDGAAVKSEVAARVGPDGFVVSAASAAPAEHTVFLTSAREPLAGGTVTSLENPPPLTVRAGEYRAAPYVVGNPASVDTGRVLGAVEALAAGLTSDAGFRFNDRLYVSRPAGATVQVGDELILARWRDQLSGVGRVLEPTAIVRVDSAPPSGTMIARIVQQFGTVNVGQMVLAHEPPFVGTTTRPVPGTYPTATKVLWIQDNPELPSLQTYVVLGAGSDQSVRAGDQFTLFDDAPGALGPSTPPVATATATVVRVTPATATAIIVHQTQPRVREGMPARLSAKMP